MGSSCRRPRTCTKPKFLDLPSKNAVDWQAKRNCARILCLWSGLQRVIAGSLDIAESALKTVGTIKSSAARQLQCVVDGRNRMSLYELSTDHDLIHREGRGRVEA